jgi:hypothetical protein
VIQLITVSQSEIAFQNLLIKLGIKSACSYGSFTVAASGTYHIHCNGGTVVSQNGTLIAVSMPSSACPSTVMSLMIQAAKGDVINCDATHMVISRL